MAIRATQEVCHYLLEQLIQCRVILATLPSTACDGPAETIRAAVAAIANNVTDGFDFPTVNLEGDVGYTLDGIDTLIEFIEKHSISIGDPATFMVIEQLGFLSLALETAHSIVGTGVTADDKKAIRDEEDKVRRDSNHGRGADHTELAHSIARIASAPVRYLGKEALKYIDKLVAEGKLAEAKTEAERLKRQIEQAAEE